MRKRREERKILGELRHRAIEDGGSVWRWLKGEKEKEAVWRESE